jgi:hypothetical protein
MGRQANDDESDGQRPFWDHEQDRDTKTADDHRWTAMINNSYRLATIHKEHMTIEGAAPDS